MANFEGLIKQALAGQNAADKGTRLRVYQSSRNALAKMLEKSGNVSDEVVKKNFHELESAIANIENDYALESTPEISDAPINEVAFETTDQPEAVDDVPDEPLNSEGESEVMPRKDAFVAPETPLSPGPGKPALNPALPNIDNYTPSPLFPPSEPQATADNKAQEPNMPLKSIAEQNSIEAEQSVQQSAPEPESFVEPSNSPGSISKQSTPQASAYPQPASDGNSQPVQSVSHTAPEYSAPDNAPIEPYLDDVNDHMMATTDQGNEDLLGEYRDDDFAAERNPMPTYKRKNPILRRIWPIFLALAVVLVVLWILYALLTNMPSVSNLQNSSNQSSSVGGSQQTEDGAISITLLEPTDLSALVTAGRGSAELITEQNRQMLRVKSIRQGTNNTSAQPILLELGKGILRQIDGKEVTVEFLAKSGLAGPAQFAVECDINGDSICGRKRFRVGLQPERIVFSLDLTSGLTGDGPAYLAINTDITNSAESSGSGDAIDIIFVKLRLPNDSG